MLIQRRKLIESKQLGENMLDAKKEFDNLENEMKQINSVFEQQYTETPDRDALTISDRFALTKEDSQVMNNRLAEIEKSKSQLTQRLTELDNIRAQAAELGNPSKKETSIENKASQVIDRSMRFSQEINSNPKDKNEWMQMKTVLKTVSRNATDEEKIAGFIKGYSDIAPIDESVYLKMNQLFDKTPVITNLGEGNKLVTVNGKSFILPAGDTKPQSVAALKYDDEGSYAGLLLLANEIGLDELKAKHKPTYDQLWKLNKKFGRTSTLTGQIFSLEEVLGVVTPLPAQPGGNTSSRFNVTVN
jgi:hypothetical protein